MFGGLRVDARPAANAALAAALAAVVVWLGPPGTDAPAHLFQLHLFDAHGFTLWNDEWYAGRWTFVGYSLLYYPLAAIIGIRTLAVLSVGLAAWAFARLVEHRFGAEGRWATRAFAAASALSLVGGAFPYALGLALALAAAVALEARRHAAFVALALLALLASPLAFLFLVVVVAAAALARRRPPPALPAVGLGFLCALAVVSWRLFPDPGHYPFPLSELAGILVFCLAAAALLWRVDGARPLLPFALLYAATSLLAYLVPSNLGGNVTRLRLDAAPLALLVLALRGWRPRPLVPVLLALALAWSVSPLAHDVATSLGDPSAQAAYWRPVTGYLERTLGRAYRVEVVGTADHWEALYLPEAGIPIARGWFRQDDFPENAALYGALTPAAYIRWLHALGVGEVVLTAAALDSSAVAEARILRSGASGLRLVDRSAHARVYAVPSPRPIVSGPDDPKILQAGAASLTVVLRRAGRYAVSLRYSPYLRAPGACVEPGSNGMSELVARRPTTVRLGVVFSLAGVEAALTGTSPSCT